ncbi:ABC transporter ATP-binding protein [Corallococcus coralloides DSM 2259]|uniref:ABC transporter ATP-binding protein n=1 Tax=Corallococcus coralloides (strain ATCC 25202 / DSM 2259 / NBRC 100086 / M2) TaxID=1144275 RepID=H8N1Z9_CORCM|nr:ABC transporter ATP-binding protein [Corallococcus coralloides]AFE11177.1 ABC transporter ATP-binding protein [Corallococcus coralloides DSM 2259]
MIQDARPAAEAPMVRLRGVSKTYRRGTVEVPVLAAVDLTIGTGAFEAFMGPSGSGKSTLLNLVSGLDRPTTGLVEVAGRDLAEMDDRELSDWRAAHVGFVFQLYNLIPVLTAAENVELPLLLTPLTRGERRRHVAAALGLVGLGHRVGHRPPQLSGGEQQRVAIARAIVSDPDLIIADEPTGDLDRKAAEAVLDLFGVLHRDLHKTLVMVTHDPHAAERAGRVHHLDKGVLQ